MTGRRSSARLRKVEPDDTITVTPPATTSRAMKGRKRVGSPMPDSSTKRRGSGRLVGSAGSSSAATPASMSSFSREGNSDTPLTNISDIEDTVASKSGKKQQSRTRRYSDETEALFKDSDDPLSDTESDNESEFDPEFEPESSKKKGKGRANSDLSDEYFEADSESEPEPEPEPIDRKGKGRARVVEASDSDSDAGPRKKPAARKGKGKAAVPNTFVETHSASENDGEVGTALSLPVRRGQDENPFLQYHEMVHRTEQHYSNMRRSLEKARKAKFMARDALLDEADSEDYTFDHSSGIGLEYIDEEDYADAATGQEIDYDIEKDTMIVSKIKIAGAWQIRRRIGWNKAVKDQANVLLMHPEFRYLYRDLAELPLIKPREDPQPPGLSLELLPFQKEGLHWLRMQEKSEWKGGILADEMGMGKTIQTIALMMTDPDAKPNLVVAPTVAIMQWKSEIEKYTGDALKVYVFHGTTKTDNWKELSKYNVILTSYGIMESDYRKQFKNEEGTSALHKIQYHRVILDEAHSIKSRSSNTAKSVLLLKTKYKLCLSGTPLQNRIGEIFSLLRFLEVDPFAYYYCRKCPCKSLHWKFEDNRFCVDCNHSPMSHFCLFNQEFLKPIQKFGYNDEGATAFLKLQNLLKHVMLRRTKRQREEDLGLPPKVMTIRRDKFSEEEHDLYNSIYSDAQRKFDTFVAQGVLLNNYANIFSLITRMRQMADHPDLFLRKEEIEGQNTIVCRLCDEEAEDPIKAKCHHTFCRDCAHRYITGYTGEAEPDCPKCHVPLVLDLTQPAMEAVDAKKNSIINRIDMSKWRSSTKIEALCEELHKLRKPTQSTKSIVFSQFTSMLQLIEWRLNKAGFKCVMLEGSMTPAQREATINHFMNNADVDVFLVSLRAGGVALNLIEASQVFLMEPWWNPSVEWQAADRIHRIGQTRVCKITRFVIENSIESKIIELQEKKANMIDATVDSDMSAMNRLTTQDMEFLFHN